jgi:hypothetical protein
MTPQPFLTFYTPTYQRPRALGRCLASVTKQTFVSEIEQVVIPDHVGRGIAGMYAQVPSYVSAVHGEYVHFLADDDVLESADVVERLYEFVRENDNPPVVIVHVVKGGLNLPLDYSGIPVQGKIDLGCAVVRGDIWRDFAGRGSYGLRYEGDFDFVAALWNAKLPFTYFPGLLFMRGAIMKGTAE